MPNRGDGRRHHWAQYLCGNEMANVLLGLLVFKIYYSNPQQYYYVFAAYYFLMAYEFYGFVKANWRAAIYGEEEEEVTEGGIQREMEPVTVEAEKEPPRRTIYPPPVDSDEELNEDSSDDDVSEVDLPKTDDESDDDEYHEAMERLI